MTVDRSYVEENRTQLERLRALVDRLSDQELSRPMEAGWTVAGVLAASRVLGFPYRDPARAVGARRPRPGAACL